MKLALLALACASCYPVRDATADRERAEAASAYRMARDRIESMLLSPGSADFAGSWLDDPRQFAKRKPDGSWVIRSHVDAQNDYGATVRAQWVVLIVDGEVDSVEVLTPGLGDVVR